jgi:riboflavin kinase/FMN adenylyltransferase
MQVFRSLEEIAGKFEKVCLAIGVFDGIHVGHQRVIGQARDDARAVNGTSAVLTFDPHPMRVLQPDKAPQLLTSTKHKLELIEKLDVDACLVLAFDKPFSLLSPEKFIETVAKTNRLQEVCVGTRFRFGHNRAGDVRLLETLAPKYGFVAKEIKSVTLENEIVSSTAIRQHVLNGRLDRAAAMLGRPVAVLGTVEPGDHRGHDLGFPTANLNPHNEVLPPDGVYAVRALVGQGTFGGVANIGVRPTFQDRPAQRILEVHLFDFDREIYGRDIEAQFLQKLRDEKKFDSVDTLKAQIAEDVRIARKLLTLS